MNTVTARISALIDRLCDGNKSSFARSLNVSPAYAAQLYSGQRIPSDRTISDICRVFNVDEIWLRTGEGEMFRPRTRGEQIAAFAGELMRDSPDSFRAAFVSVLSELSLEDWKILERLATEALSRTASPNPPATQNQED